MAEKRRRARALPPFIVAVVTGIFLIAGAAFLLDESVKQQNVTGDKDTDEQTLQWEAERGAGR